MSEHVDVSPYVRPPVLNVAGAVSLSTALLAALPKDAPAAVRKAEKRLRARATALEEAWRAAERVGKREDSRPPDQAIDNAWAALHQRLEAFASLDDKRVPRAGRADELLSILFPEGLAFLELPYAEEWSESQKRLERIAADGLAKDLDALAGKEFLAEVRAAHERYGKAIGVTAARAEEEPAASVVEPLRQVSRAIAAYAVQVVAAAEEEGDRATARALMRALWPIDAHRSDAAKRKTKVGEVPPGE